MNELHIELPAAFDAIHERAVTDYLTDRVSGSAAWARVFAAMDVLEAAFLIVETERLSFRAVYTLLVDRPLADVYIADLLALQDVRQESPALRARYARRIGQSLVERGWRRPETRHLFAYLLYWWGSFARGYALEVEIFRDLEASGVPFQAHDLRDPQARYSLSDLTVASLAGDIKTSTYFVQAAAPLAHDFYIVRLAVKGAVHTLVVMLQPEAWAQINGDTTPGTMDTLLDHFPAPVAIRHRGHDLVVLGYETWKQRMLLQQGGAE
ncbi:hypothetical protein [Candidatus Chloroploca sp. Khr17]|uniref:hypothetical protein n=1 Tax=Candidatus Chloroploca sp. Khr17 TaxID=2496869 RepID=UPI00101CBA40|nr:hypothetical protein [Candidatus Chloroploca sp. Khr17]